MNDLIMDKLQWAFDLLYGMFPRRLRPAAVKPLLVGHRGVFEHPEIKENTLAAFDLAVSHGGGIEFDLHLTLDDVVVVHHDPTLTRVHGVALAVADLTLAQLQEVAPEVPTLDEVFARYGHRCPHYFMEPKVRGDAARETLLSKVGISLRRFRLAQSATVISTDRKMLDLMRLRLPQVAKALIFFVDYRSCVAYVRHHGDTGLAGWYFTYPEAVRSFLEQRGLHVGVGQVDYENTHRHYRNRGFRYHFSNRIDRLTRPVDPLTLPVLPEQTLVEAGV